MPTTPDAVAAPIRDEPGLAAYAMTAARSRGRRYPEPDRADRSAFQRDRERLTHCAAFRRLLGKTQVLVAGVNDHHRTRLTHTLEVAQIARAVARQLHLNEDLAEAIALSHDLGHPPFGHAGESALDQCLAGLGGYEHNRHALRIVEDLEDRYPDFPGLNLSWEVREAMAQHSSRGDDPAVREYRDAGEPLMEARVVDAADSLAYDTHDLDDALGSGLLTLADVSSLGFWLQAVARVRRRHGDLADDPLRFAVVRELIDWQVTDLVARTRQNLEAAHVRTLADVRRTTEPLVEHSPAVRPLKAELQAFLMERVYRHPRVLRLSTKGRRFLTGMYAEFVRVPELLPTRHLKRVRALVTAGTSPAAAAGRVAGDYLAGMTDRFAQQEYVRLFQPTPDV
jgi:dGTPase